MQTDSDIKRNGEGTLRSEPAIDSTGVGSAVNSAVVALAVLSAATIHQETKH